VRSIAVRRDIVCKIQQDTALSIFRGRPSDCNVIDSMSAPSSINSHVVNWRHNSLAPRSVNSIDCCRGISARAHWFPLVCPKHRDTGKPATRSPICLLSRSRLFQREIPSDARRASPASAYARFFASERMRNADTRFRVARVSSEIFYAQPVIAGVCEDVGCLRQEVNVSQAQKVCLGAEVSSEADSELMN
jgi:hypothetical protein